MNLKVVFRTLSAFIRTHLGRYVKPRRYGQIFEEIEKIKPKNILEIGTWNGKRAKQMIECAAQFHPVDALSYFGFDLFEKMDESIYKQEISKVPPKRDDVYGYLKGIGANIRLYSGYTQDTLTVLKELQAMDFVYIDGGHATETVLNDWNKVKEYMSARTVVIFDDYWHNRSDGPKVVIDAIDKGVFDVEFLPEVDVFFNKDFGRLVISLVKVARK
ncbi:MAG: hypothetical protein A2920_02725 [Candidatus Zambryskibacteria bacterium RIFCSPLOWO2_01_FULL_43_17]|uniref:Methyltransferase n=1 Tax=Candidatus Zambryskibacteria bacterium RIFCSPLOWO2_01_FULL_43_17 TaxID=1802760 RepID=A0A1G2U3Y8_9BACT|nr:MAG: hypothetical protein A2920_02725 [Candidatus Zambryskibacteria bacterium RIFCSPLOWO2_01_FULL_43_17]